MKTLIRFLDKYVSVFSFIVVVGAWESLVRLLHVKEFILPPPSSIVVALWEGLAGGAILTNLCFTLYETMIGFVIATVVGVFLGAVITQFSIVDRAVYPYVVAFQSMPKMAIAPLLVIWFGFGLTSKIIMAAMIAFFPILVNTIEGIHSTSPTRLDLLRSLGASRWQAFWMVKWPSSLGPIYAGVESGIVLALLGSIVGEFVGAQVGLGNQILIENFRMNIAAVFAILIVLAVVGVILHRLVVIVHRRHVFWVG